MWQPKQDLYNYILQLLRSGSGSDAQAHSANVTKAINDVLVQVPDANYYFALILISSESGEPEQVRGLAGLILKNNMKQQGFQQEFLHHLIDQNRLLSALKDSQPFVRSTVGTLLSTIVLAHGENITKLCPNLFDELLVIASSDPKEVAVAAASALEKICEDAVAELVQDETQVLDRLIPGLLRLISGSRVAEVRLKSLGALNQFILSVPEAMDTNLDTLLVVLSQVAAASDTDSMMKQTLCQSLNYLMESYPEKLEPTLPPILEYCFQALQDKEEEGVALEACEFWLSLAEKDVAIPLLTPILPRLVPVLLHNMVYSEEDADLQDNDEESALVPDQAHEIKPRHHKATVHTTSKLDREAGEQSEDGAESERLGSDDDDEEEDEDEEDQSSWNLRKCSAATLDVLSISIPQEVLVPILLPLINQQLGNADWRFRECSILALGAISEGCLASMKPHLQQIVPFLIENLSYPKPVVRAISAWTLSRYSSWISDASGPIGDASVKALVQGMSDGNKKVQQACCSALGLFSEKASDLITKNLGIVLQGVQWALERYQAKNMLLLYDVITTLADELGNRLLSQGALINGVLQVLVQRLLAFQDNDSAMFPLLECICSIAVEAGACLGPFACAIYDKAIEMAHDGLDVISHGHPDEAAIEFVVVALDLIGGLIQGLKDGMGRISKVNYESLGGLLVRTCEKANIEINQSAFAVVGDCAQCFVEPIADRLKRILPAMQACAYPSRGVSVAAANNAVWALGELCLRHASLVRSFVPVFLQQILAIIDTLERGSLSGYAENIAVSCGRAIGALEDGQRMNLRLADAAVAKWVEMIQFVEDKVELETAWIPMLEIISYSKNPRQCQIVVEALQGMDLDARSDGFKNAVQRFRLSI